MAKEHKIKIDANQAEKEIKGLTDNIKKLKRVVEVSNEGSAKQKRAMRKLSSAVKQAKKDFNEYGKAVDRSTKLNGKFRLTTKGLQRQVGILRNKLLLVSFAFALVGKSVQKLISGYGEQEQAERLLANRLGHVNKGLLEQASAIQKVTIHGDEANIRLMTLGANLGINEDQLGEATKAAIGLSTAYGLDLNMSMRAIAMAQQGNTDMLMRYIPALRNTNDETEKLAIVNDAAAKGYKQAKAQADTMTGSVDQMKNAMGDSAESLGRLLAPAVNWVAKSLTNASTSANSFFSELRQSQLEKTISRFRELGASTESIMKLQKIQIERNLIRLNSKLKNTKGYYSDIDVLHKKISDNQKKSTKIASTLANQESIRISNSKEYDTLLKERLLLIRDQENREKIIAEKGIGGLNAMIDLNTKQMAINQEKDDDLQAAVKHGEESLIQLNEESELLGENLNLIIDINTQEAERLALNRMQEDQGKQTLRVVKETKDTLDKFFTIRISPLDKMGYDLTQLQMNMSLYKDEINNTKQALTGFTSAWNDNLQSRINQEVATLKDSEAYREADAERRADLERGITKEYAKEQLLKFRVGQAMAIADIAMNTSAALMKSVAGSWVTIGQPWFNIIAGLGALQAGMVMSQKPPQAFAKGGDFVTNKPELIMVGEAGREHVKITPVDRPESRALKGGGDIVLNISAPLVDETVIDSIIPAIQKAQRMNLA